jgi:hypothetical protein
MNSLLTNTKLEMDSKCSISVIISAANIDKEEGNIWLHNSPLEINT